MSLILKKQQLAFNKLIETVHAYSVTPPHSFSQYDKQKSSLKEAISRFLDTLFIPYDENDLNTYYNDLLFQLDDCIRQSKKEDFIFDIIASLNHCFLPKPYRSYVFAYTGTQTLSSITQLSKDSIATGNYPKKLAFWNPLALNVLLAIDQFRIYGNILYHKDNIKKKEKGSIILFNAHFIYLLFALYLYPPNSNEILERNISAYLSAQADSSDKENLWSSIQDAYNTIQLNGPCRSGILKLPLAATLIKTLGSVAKEIDSRRFLGLFFSHESQERILLANIGSELYKTYQISIIYKLLSDANSNIDLFPNQQFTLC